jgi:hypothetical protein
VEKVIFIPTGIWRIKKLNFIEKAILSDIYNMTFNHKGVYNKHKETLAKDLGISLTKIENSLKKLKTLEFINSKKTFSKDQAGKITGCKLVTRIINIDKINQAEKFNISTDNIFFSKYNKGFTFSYKEIQRMYAWKEKERISKMSTVFLALYVIIHKNSFNKDYLDRGGLFCRFKKTDLYEVLGVTRPTGKKIIDDLFRVKKYNINNEIIEGRIIADIEVSKIDDFDLNFEDGEDWAINEKFLKQLNIPVKPIFNNPKKNFY